MATDRSAGFGALLRYHRLAAGLTQEELAERAGLSVRGIAALELGERLTPRKETMLLLADALGLSPQHRAAFLAARGRTALSAALRFHPRPHNLPLPATPFIGRELERDTLRQRILLPAVRLLTLTGTGGTGKTRLALEVARDVVEAFPDGMCFVSLASITDPALIAAAIAQRLGVGAIAGQSLRGALKTALREQRLLLILDNFEQVLPAAPLVTELLAACAGLKALVTSRAVLRVYGEYSFPVPPLNLPDPDQSRDPATLLQYAGVRLYVECAQAVRPDFALTEANAAAVVEVCRKLDGLPLAIELAAARSTLLAPRAMLGRLGSRLKLLTGGARDVPARHQTMRATIAWSYDLLDEPERTLFRRLGVFTGGWTLEAAEAVWHPEGEQDLLEPMSSLVDKSLVRQHEDVAGESRFGMLELVREYALERLEASGEAQEMRRRHAMYYLGLAEQAEPELRGRNQMAWLARLEVEHDNLRVALVWSQARAARSASSWIEDPAVILRLVGALGHFWFLRGHFEEWERWFDQVVAAVPMDRGAVSPVLLGNVLFGRAMLAQNQGDARRALPLATESLTLYQNVGDRRGMAASLAIAGWAHVLQGAVAAGRAQLVESLEQAREVNDSWLVAWVCYVQGTTAWWEGQYAQATIHLEASLPLARAIGDQWLVARALWDLGRAAEFTNDYARARRLFEESLAIQRQLSDKLGMAHSLGGLAGVARAFRDYPTARELTTQRLQIDRQLGNKRGIAYGLLVLGEIALDQGDYPQATALLEESLALYQELGAKEWLADVWGVLGQAALAQGNYARAMGCFEAIRTQACAAADQVMLASSLNELGRAALAQGDYAQAMARYRESLPLCQDLLNQGHPRPLSHVLVGIAGVVGSEERRRAGGTRDVQQAVRLFAAAWVMDEAAGEPSGWELPWSFDRWSFDRRVDAHRRLAAVRAQLDEAVFAAAWAAGRVMPLDEVVEGVLDTHEQ
jgi:predicted ATPase/uncharacterized protein HemY/DNA-binding XRE family transcriptional regulator